MQSSPVLVPPPPTPPVTGIAAGDYEPWREPSGESSNERGWKSFLRAAFADLRQLLWLRENQVAAKVFITFGVLFGFTVFIFALNTAAKFCASCLGF